MKQLSTVELEAMTVKQLRKLSWERGYGIRYMTDRRKSDLIVAIQRCQADALKVRQREQACREEA